MFKCPSCDYEINNMNSLRIHASKKHNISSEDLYVEVVLKGVKPTCKCGCGTATKFHGPLQGYSEYVWGHAAKINNNWGHNELAKEKSLKTRKGMWERGEIKGWCAGLTKEDPRIASIVEKMNTPERAKKISDSLSGKKKSDAHKAKIKEQMQAYWSDEDNKAKQSLRQAECVKNGMLTKATRVHGYFENPKKSSKLVYYRSLFELNAVLYFESNADIISYEMEPYRIQYEHDEKIRNYVIDCLIEYADGRKLLIELKPSCHLKDPKNLAKFNAAELFALKMNMSFEIWTEKTHPFIGFNSQIPYHISSCHVEQHARQK